MKKEIKKIEFINERKTTTERDDEMIEGIERAGIEMSIPQKIVNIEELSKEEWLQYRRKGFGGSDAGVIAGVNHWTDFENLYRDKKGLLKPETIDYKKQAMFDMGHLAEDVIGKIVHGMTGFTVFKDNWMYHHSAYPWMLADCDLFAYDLQGKKVGIECKYINHDDLKMKWRSGIYGQEAKVGNMSYLVQCRHYMSVLNLDRWYLCVWGGNNADDLVMIRVDRDYDFERELIIAEDKAWNQIQNDIVPTVSAKSDMAFEKIEGNYELDKKEKPAQLSNSLAEVAKEFSEIKNNISAYNAEIKTLKERANALEIKILDALNEADSARGMIKADNDSSYLVSYLSTGDSSSFDWKGLKAADPDTLEYLMKNGFFKQKPKKPTFKLDLKENQYI